MKMNNTCLQGKWLQNKWFQKTRKLVLVLAVGSLALVGCSQLTYDLKQTWDYALKKNQDVVLSQAEIEAFPYTALYGRVGNQAQILIVLGFIDKTGPVQRLNWITGSRESITTEQARIIETSGLDVNLVGVSDIEQDPLRCIANDYFQNKTEQTCNLQWVRQADFTGEIGAGTETLISRFEVLGEVELALPNTTKKVLHVKETGRFVFARQAFENEFWIERDGHVVKSKQQLHPTTAPLELTQVKWIGRDGY